MSNLYRLSILLAFAALLAVLSQADATEYPVLPKVPTKFNTPEEVQQYLGKLHNYYVMVGRPRFGKRANLFEAAMTQEEDGIH